MVYFELLICEIKLIKVCSSQEVLSHLSPVFLRKHNQGIHSKSESRDPNWAAKKFELSANLFKNATKWPKNGQK